MKRILLVMMQPPGCSGVQGLIYDKILPYTEQNGWEFHFAGPSPELTSVIIEKVNCPKSRLHYTDHVSWSKRYSVLKNRQDNNSVGFYFYGFLQLLSQRIEKLFRHDPNAYLVNGLNKTVKAANDKWNYDLIAGKSPDFIVLDAVSSLTKSIHKPLVAMIIDPHGEREEFKFYPYDEMRQKSILDQCVGAMFMSPLTRDRYIQSGLLAPAKAYAFNDSYPSNPIFYQSNSNESSQVTFSPGSKPIQLSHLGMLPKWRPIETFLEAVESFPDQILINLYGFLYPEAQKTIQSNSLLRKQIHLGRPGSYIGSHQIAQQSDALLVIIGPRHMDNQPSKFFEYLGHKKPYLILGPPSNPIQEIVNRLGIGVYANISDPAAIREGIAQLVHKYPTYVNAFEVNKMEVEAYNDKNVAKHWCNCLNKMLDSVA